MGKFRVTREALVSRGGAWLAAWVLACSGCVEQVGEGESEEAIKVLANAPVDSTDGGGGPGCTTDPVTGFGGGNGTATLPFVICYASHLDRVRRNLSAHYVLGKSFSLYAVGNFVPIGPAFTGTFDGAGNTISYLKIQTASDAGLFLRLAKGAVVRNLTLHVANVTGLYGVGTLAGHAEQATIDNVRVLNSTVQGDWAVGGLVGYAERDANLRAIRVERPIVRGRSSVGGVVGRLDGSLTDAVATDVTLRGEAELGGVAGSSAGAFGVRAAIDDAHTNLSQVQPASWSPIQLAGGIVGWAVETDIARSSANVTLVVPYDGRTNPTHVGGLVGQLYKSTLFESRASGSISGAIRMLGGAAGEVAESTVDDSYAQVSLDGNGGAHIGGFVGYAANSVLRTSYSTGLVVDYWNIPSIGGFAGSNGGDNIVSGSGWDTRTSTQPTSAFGAAMSTAQLMDQTRLEALGWTFDADEGPWAPMMAGSYPRLWWE